MSKLKKEAGTLRKIMQGYVVTIDSLNQANIALQAERDAMAQEVTEVRERNSALVQKQDNMEEIIEAGRVLQAMDLNPMAIRVSSTGSQRETSRAKRAEMIKTCFHPFGEQDCREGRTHLVFGGVGPERSGDASRRPCSSGHAGGGPGFCSEIAGLRR